MDNPTFINEKNIPMVQDGDDDYRSPGISRVDDTSFTLPDTTEAISTLRLRQEVK